MAAIVLLYSVPSAMGAEGLPDAGTAEAGPTESNSSTSGITKDRPPALSDTMSPWYAAAIGALGSAAYLVVVWVGLLGTNDGRDRVLRHFRRLWGAKVPLYVSSGAGVAMVFQLPEAKLVPVQAFIIGCTWPAVVSNYLSGRQAGEGDAQALEAYKKQQDAEKLQAVAAAVPEPRAMTEHTTSAIDEIIAELGGANGPADDDGTEGDG